MSTQQSEARPPAAGKRAAAFFDVDGTLVHSNIVGPYFLLRHEELPGFLKPLWLVCFGLKCLLFLLIDAFSRRAFNHFFYRSYRGRKVESAPAMAQLCFEKYFLPRIFPEAAEALRNHRAQNHEIVLVTGSLDFLVAPLASHWGISSVLAASLGQRNGTFTGALSGEPVCDQEKARRIGEFAVAQAIDLEASHAYGDSIADLPMLECVGHPHAVNPDRSLAANARKNNWEILTWRKRE